MSHGAAVLRAFVHCMNRQTTQQWGIGTPLCQNQPAVAIYRVGFIHQLSAGSFAGRTVVPRRDRCSVVALDRTGWDRRSCGSQGLSAIQKVPS